MGGQSSGNFSVVSDHAVFQGTVRNVSFLHAPGFCRAFTTSFMLQDASAYVDGGITITARSSTPAFKGFKLAIGAIGAPKHHGGHEMEGSYKAGFAIAKTYTLDSILGGDDDGWSTVYLPFTEFSSDWSDFSGECTTKDPDGYQHKCCSKDAPEVCPNAKTLKLINNLALWAEGVEGDFHIEVKSIEATSKVAGEML